MSPGAAARQLPIEVKGLVLEMNQRALSRSRRGVNILRNVAMEVLGHDGGGRTYRNGHVASAPGQPPAPDTGNLRRNWQGKTFAHANGKGLGITVHMQIKSQMLYHDFLEKGTRKMAARPFHNRIKQKARPPITALFASI